LLILTDLQAFSLAFYDEAPRAGLSDAVEVDTLVEPPNQQDST
jgi:hypothetical protein